MKLIFTTVKQRIMRGWNAMRVMYTAIGGLIIEHSTRIGLEWGVLFGAYFVLMGVLALGCAGGTCVGEYCSINPADTSKQQAPPPHIHIPSHEHKHLQQ